MSKDIKRGDIWIADLGAPTGSEQRGVRPVLILQNDVGNAHSPTVIVAGMTDISKRYMPTHVPIWAKDSGLSKDSSVLLEQIRTIDKSLLRNYVGTAPEEVLVKVNYAIRVSMGLIPPPQIRKVGGR